MKKIMWIGLFIELIMLLIIFLLTFMQQPIPDLVANLFTGGMLMCIVSAFIVKIKSNKGANNDI